MKTLFRTYFCFAIIIHSLESYSQRIESYYLIGIWQDGQDIGSGWSDNYQFFQDGTFQFNYNQMNCSKRIIDYRGKWRIENDKLVLIYTNRKFIDKGHYVPDPLCDSIIVNGKVKIKKLKEPLVKRVSVSIEKPGLLNGFGPKIDHILINNLDFYRISSDPNDY